MLNLTRRRFLVLFASAASALVSLPVVAWATRAKTGVTVHHLAYSEDGQFEWYSGYDPLPTGPLDDMRGVGGIDRTTNRWWRTHG